MPSKNKWERRAISREKQPDFISVTAYHAWAARLDEDPRLAKDYIPVNTGPDEWVMRRYGIVMESGDYVRRELVRDDSALARLRESLAESRGHP